MLPELISELQAIANQKQAKILQKFFKTRKGEYGEGDVFLGIKVPVQRKIAKKYYGLSLKNIQKLLNSKIHEHRMVSLLILIERYKKGDKTKKESIFKFYLENARKKNINNWDLVDLSAPKIIGDHLNENLHLSPILKKLAKSKNLWERRIAIVSTYSFIQKKKFNPTLRISEILLNDKHDLIHKSVGWMLREVGKRNEKILEDFLRKNYQKIPRTTLRYAIEKFEETKRKEYLKGRV